MTILIWQESHFWSLSVVALVKWCHYVSDKTAKEVAKKLWVIFNDFGLPNEIPKDGATAFAGAQFL